MATDRIESQFAGRSGTFPGKAFAPSAENGNAPSKHEPLRILIVEDEVVTAYYLEDTLNSLGYSVVGSVEDGPDALVEVARLKPDLILMDVRLAGGSDGVAAAIEIRQKFDIPSIFMTAQSDTATRERAALAQPLGYAVKPLLPHKIAEIIRDAEEQIMRRKP